MSTAGGPPAVTFVCCAYRTEDTVADTIDSVLAQTRDDWQLVVVDNGPSDEMERIVRPYTDDPRVTLIRQPNAFAAGGVNAGARAAEGRYVVVLHTDDLVTPRFMERLVPVLDERPEVAMVCPDALYLTGRGLRRPTYREPVPEVYRRGDPVTLKEMIEGWVPYYVGPVRREVWEEIGGFRTDAQTVEDLAFFVDVLALGHEILVVEEVLAYYREDDDSDSRGLRGVEVMEESFERVLTAAVADFGTPDDEAALREVVPRSRHLRASVRAWRLLLEGDVDGACEAADLAVTYRDDRRTRAVALVMRRWPRTMLAAYKARKVAVRLRQRVSPRDPYDLQGPPARVSARG
ncbi:glycosyltransferase family A protein [Nocardioides sp. C4-1]|uniref:glycosyltransferase family A protein n=1 Tax=Nocardioides sp. C4-1 TaxID=3151851 RepID=UPI003265914D